MHDEIKSFSMNGMIAETNIVQTKERLVNSLESLMRDYGYVPALDLDPQFTIDYNSDTETFNFALTVYGMKTNKEEAWTVGGIMNGKKIPRHIHQDKSMQSSVNAE